MKTTNQLRSGHTSMLAHTLGCACVTGLTMSCTCGAYDRWFTARIVQKCTCSCSRGRHEHLEDRCERCGKCAAFELAA